MYSYIAVLENWRKQSVAFTMHTLSVSDFPDWSHLVCPERGFQAVTHVMSLLQLFLIMTVVYHALLAQEHAPMHSHKHIRRLRQMQIDTQIDTCMQTHTCTGTHRNTDRQVDIVTHSCYAIRGLWWNKNFSTFDYYLYEIDIKCTSKSNCKLWLLIVFECKKRLYIYFSSLVFCMYILLIVRKKDSCVACQTKVQKVLDINDDIYGPDGARIISVKAWDCE